MKQTLSRLAYFIFAAFGLIATCMPVSALILYGLDNNSNTSDPGTGAPWDHVAKISDSTGGSIEGSGVYLGNGYMLTANHVSLRSHITFDDNTFYEIDNTFTAQQVAPDVDMKVFKLLDNPGLQGVNLNNSSNEVGNQAMIVGWGVGGSGTGSTISWGNGTEAKRWGTNTVLSSDSDAFGFDSLVTVLGDDEGNNEAAVTSRDSGGALFQEIDSIWYLSGIATNVEFQAGENTSTFGADTTSDFNPLNPRGDKNYFVRISTYESDILMAIPEPASFAITLGVCTILFLIVRRRRRCRTS